jgi:phosphoribosyl 1,2-cyclic phosphodiesterase
VSLRFASLGSGSRGNATLVESSNGLLMVDCGFTLKETQIRLSVLGVNVEDIKVILVTHEHGDHIKGVGPFARKFNVPVYMTHGTAKSEAFGKLPDLQLINTHRSFQIEDVDVRPVAVPHDAKEPCQFVFSKDKKALGLLTDLGSITPFLIEQYRHCDAMMLECNHDSHMLATGSYHQSLKIRVGGNWGHLNNLQAAGLLRELEHERMQHLVICHISENNNTEQLAHEAISEVYGDKDSLIMAKQDEFLDWLVVS